MQIIKVVMSGQYQDASAVVQRHNIRSVTITETVAPRSFCEIELPDSEENRLKVRRLSQEIHDLNLLRAVELSTTF